MGKPYTCETGTRNRRHNFKVGLHRDLLNLEQYIRRHLILYSIGSNANTGFYSERDCVQHLAAARGGMDWSSRERRLWVGCGGAGTGVPEFRSCPYLVQATAASGTNQHRKQRGVGMGRREQGSPHDRNLIWGNLTRMILNRGVFFHQE